MSEIISKILDIALCHFKAGRPSLAAEYCGKALTIDPVNLEAMYLSARIAESQQDFRSAAKIVETMLEINLSEDFFADFTVFSREAGLHEKAINFFRKYLRDNSDSFSGWYHLGIAAMGNGNMEQAKQAFFRATRLRPEEAKAWHQLASAKEKEFDYLDAIGHMKTALDIEPASAHYCNYIAGLLKAVGLADVAEEYFKKTLELSSGNNIHYSNYLMNFLCTTDDSPDSIFREHQQWGDKCLNESGPPFDKHNNLPQPLRRLKVGYVSADFYHHPVAFFIEPVITMHDPDAIDLYIYSNVEKEDDITRQFRQRSCTWRDIYGKTDDEVFSIIREDTIDILVDLSGHTKLNRLSLFARKPAPVQASWLGYANTTGLKAIDYRLTDAVADPPGLTEQFHTEELYRLPGSFICYHPPLDTVDVSPSPFEKNGYITFVALNNFAKVNQPLISLWSEVLKQVPESRLLLKEKGLQRSASFRAEVHDRFAKEGITVDRLIMVEKTVSVHHHLDYFSQGDISLDSFPYSGTTTVCEALWMGLPVVALAGAVHASRVSASLLTTVGIPELIARNKQEYVETATLLASNPSILKNYRQKLREMMRKSSLMDVPGFTAKLENAYRNMWELWCSKSDHR